MSSVHLHYWAGARAAAGTAQEVVEAATIRDALTRAGAERDAHFARVVAASSLLLDGVAVHPADLDRALTGSVSVEVLPPFAGGSARDHASRMPD